MMPKSPPRIVMYQRPKRDSWGSNTDFYRSTAWIKLRNAYREMYPLCCQCLEKDITKTILGNQGVVDHIEPRTKRPDLELEWSNLQSLCHSCHAEKTNKER